MKFRIFIWFVFIIGGLIAGIFLDIRYFSSSWTNIYWHIISFIVGVLLMKLVFTISKNTGRMLAKKGRKGDIPRGETNILVKQGVYGCMRHPMHLGLFLFPLSFAFLSGSLSFILFIAPTEIILMIIMVFSIEEPEAIKKFGQQYLNYKKEVPAFSLKIRCLKKLLEPVEKG